MQRFDIMVIGGGTAGLRTSLSAASKGEKTVMIEPGTIGGTCLNTGCIPTKAMLHASHLYREINNSEEFGISAKPKIDFKKLMERVRSFPYIGQEHIKKSIKKDNLTVIRKKANFTGKKTVRVGKDEITADKIIICTGSKNFIPRIKGIEDIDYLDNVKTIYDLKKLPKDIVMIGGGYISMEFATFFHELGVEVTVLERLPNILMLLDDDVVETVTDIYLDKGMDIRTNINIMNVEEKKGKVKITYNDVREKESPKKTISAEKIFVATGRKPNTEFLDLDKAGIKTEKGGIIVNDYLETSAKDVYAIGDCLGKALFAHAAKRETYVVLDNAIHNKKRKMDFKNMPWAVFTYPPIAGVALSEKEIKGDYDVYKAKFSKAGRSSIIGETRGFVKIMTNKKGKILGSQIIGPNADDIIHEVVAVMNSKGNIEAIQKAIHVHPTLSEVMEELKQ